MGKGERGRVGVRRERWQEIKEWGRVKEGGE